MMAGAVAVLSAAGCALVGGHSSEGPEPALGFSITGTRVLLSITCACVHSSLLLPAVQLPIVAPRYPRLGAAHESRLTHIAGVAREAELLRKGGLAAGQALLLTKALGTGALLAAGMRLRGSGAWLAGGGRRSCNEHVD